MKKNAKKKILKHLKSDMKTFKHEAAEDKKLMKSIRDAHKDGMHGHKKRRAKKKHIPETKRAHNKIEKVMHEYKQGELHSGSKKGPKVKNRKQAIAIALSEARRAKKK